jgi:hypothetical protein
MGAEKAFLRKSKRHRPRRQWARKLAYTLGPVIVRRRFLLGIGLNWGLFYMVIFARMIALNEHGLQVGHENVWSDWALHVGLATVFAEKSPADWFAYHPMYANEDGTRCEVVALV